jgi:DNA polymerase (family X)
MTNKEIAKVFSDLATIMELHGENTFKIRSYSNAYITLRKLDTPLAEMPRSEIDAIKGVGVKIGDKIIELLKTGSLETYQKYADMTPPGVVEMLHIKGFGSKKVLAVWKELEIETIGELLYACNENRLIELHGFGAKTQEEVRKSAEYYLTTKGKLLYAVAEAEANKVAEWLRKSFAQQQVQVVGELIRLCSIVEHIEILTTTPINEIIAALDGKEFRLIGEKEGTVGVFTANEAKVYIHSCGTNEYGSKLFRYSSSKEYLEGFVKEYQGIDFRNLANEEEVFNKVKLPFIPPALRENPNIIQIAQKQALPNLITLGDIKGVVHTHTTYSDGLNTLKEMADTAQRLGYGYIVITDHSKAAFYAQGLKEDRLQAQWNEIDELNKAFFGGFKILKGIESDILNDGSLDYSDDILKGFDLIIASIHSNLKMNEEKATARLIKAIENPYTHILGHPTGRLLLSRAGYPIDHKKVIEACAANKVSIELNANPYRLDLDWSWIPYAIEKGVKISINPDAHSCSGIQDIRYGVLVANKGMLTKENCLNALDLEGFLNCIQK